MSLHLTKKIAEYLGVAIAEVKRVEKWEKVYFVVIRNRRATFVSKKAVIDHVQYAIDLSDRFTPMQSPIRFKFLGATQDATVCDCCGKQDLKKTAVLQIQDTSFDGWQHEHPTEENIGYYGSSCALKLLASGRDNKNYKKNRNKQFTVTNDSFIANDGTKVEVTIVNDRITKALACRPNKVVNIADFENRSPFLAFVVNQASKISDRLKKQLDIAYFE